MMRRYLPMVLVLVLAFSAAAQEAPPALMVKIEGKSQPLGISKVACESRIVGRVAETRMTLTFANPHKRALAGDLYFPLPEGATVSGYALDINGVMVDASVVEKDIGRMVFEEIVREGVDPGLVEWVGGNNFRTRVFPIPAGGTRTVRVDYVTELGGGKDGPAFHLPLNFKNKLKEFSLRVEVVKPPAEPKIKQGRPANFAFKKWRDSFVAETRLKDVLPAKDLIITLPDVSKQAVLVEKATDGQYYFCIYDDASQPRAATAAAAPKRIAVFWDASGSRGLADHKREIDLLKSYLMGKDIIVDLVVFRDVAQSPRRFVIRGAKAMDALDNHELIAALRNVRYDGGTAMSSIAPQTTADQAEVNFLFTDGLSNFGPDDEPIFEGALYIFSNDAGANHTYLRYLAMRSGGGQYFNLQRLGDKQVLQSIGRPAFSFISAAAKSDKGDATAALEMYPKLRQPVHGRFTLVGKLPCEAAEVTLGYGTGGEPDLKRGFTVSRKDAPEGDLLRRCWAQKKLTELMVRREANRDRIIALGKEFNLVTPYTSLIVLESMEQYVRYRIRPPKTMPKWRTEYEKEIDTIEAQKKKAETGKLKTVLAMWDQRLKWWDRKFKYPKDFKYSPPKPTTAPTSQAVVPEQRLRAMTEELKRSGEQLKRAMAKAEQLLAKADTLEGKAALAQAKAQLVKARLELEVGLEELNGVQQILAALRDGQVVLRTLAPGGLRAASQPGDGVIYAAVKVVDLSSLINVNADSDGDGPGFILTTAGTDREFSTAGGFDAGGGFGGEQEPGVGPAVVVKAWDPKAPYLSALKKAAPEKRFAAYMAQRKKYGKSPGFFLDCSEFFFRNNQRALGMQVLSNIAELELESPALLRVLGHRLARIGKLDLAVLTLEQVLKLRPDEPQSHRDLALLLAARAREMQRILAVKDMPRQAAQRMSAQIRADYGRAIKLLNKVVMGHWSRRDDFEGIEVIALMEANHLIPHAKAAGLKDIPLDKRLIRLPDVDVRIVLTWDADNTDIDLWVIEPSGEKAYYEHQRTTIGGLLSQDFTSGYGPEEYVLRRAMKGTYTVKANYFGSDAAKMLGPVTLRVDIFTNFGRDNEKRKSITLRLKDAEETATVADIKF